MTPLLIKSHFYNFIFQKFISEEPLQIISYFVDDHKQYKLLE